MNTITCTAFAGANCIASGDLAHVALKTKEWIDRGELASVLVFDDHTSRLVEIDFRGSAEDVLKRLPRNEPEAEAPRGPGRPKLGVVAREVTLLPRHWEWLNEQPGGASVALRKLVEEARKANEGRDRLREAQEAAYRFMSAMGGNEPGFEEATRALYRCNSVAFDALIEPWPADVREHTRKLAQAAFLACV